MINYVNNYLLNYVIILMIPIIEIRDTIKSYYYKNFIFSDLFVIWYKKNLVIF